MENKNIDTELKILFQNHKQDIENNGFSEKVMQNIPQKHRNKEWIVIPFAVAGGVVAFILASYSGLFERIMQAIQSDPISFIFALPFVLLAAIAVFILFERNRHLQFPFD